MTSSIQASTLWRLLTVVLLLWLVWQLRQPAMLIFGAVLFAATLRAMADPLTELTHWSPQAATAVVLVLSIALLAGALWLVGNPLAEQLHDLRQQLPNSWNAVRGWLADLPFGQRLLALGDDLRDGSLPWSNIASVAGRAVNGLSALVLIGLMGLYLAFDVRLYRDGLVQLFRPPHRPAVSDALDAAGHALSRWLLGQALTMLAVGVAVAVGLALLGMPMALALGLISGLLEFVPFLGPIASGALAVLVAFVQGPDQALYVALLFVAVQQIEGNLLVPLIQRWAVHLPPALSVGAVVIFGSLFGVPGILFGTPLMVITMVLVQHLYVQRMPEGDGA